MKKVYNNKVEYSITCGRYNNNYILPGPTASLYHFLEAYIPDIQKYSGNIDQCFLQIAYLVMELGTSY